MWNTSFSVGTVALTYLKSSQFSHSYIENWGISNEKQCSTISLANHLKVDKFCPENKMVSLECVNDC